MSTSTWDIGAYGERIAASELEKLGYHNIIINNNDDDYEDQVRSRDITAVNNNNLNFYISVKTGKWFMLRVGKVNPKGEWVGQEHNEINDAIEKGFYHLAMHVIDKNNIIYIRRTELENYIRKNKIPAGENGSYLKNRILYNCKENLLNAIETAKINKRSGWFSDIEGTMKRTYRVEENNNGTYSVFLVIPTEGYSIGNRSELAKAWTKEMVNYKR